MGGFFLPEGVIGQNVLFGCLVDLHHNWGQDSFQLLLHLREIFFGTEHGLRTVQQLERRLDKSLDLLFLPCLEPLLELPVSRSEP